MLVDSASLKTESDVEQKLLYPLLTDVLGYSDGEIKTKEYLAPTNVDKGAGKRVGYYPDYVVYIGSLPILAIEAKDPSTNIEEGYREARLYAAEINKRFDTGINPVKYILTSNGQTILLSTSDSDTPILRSAVTELAEGEAPLDTLRLYCARASIIHEVTDLQRRLHHPTRHRPLRLLGGPSRQNATIKSNTFSERLLPILRRYFDPDETQHSVEIIERGYVASEEITKYNAELEALLKQRTPLQDNVTPIKTTKKHASDLDSALSTVTSNQVDIPDPLIIILGGVGAGKSIFLQRYFEFLIPDSINSTAITLTVDFNKADSNLNNADEWICQACIEAYKRKFGNEALAYENLLRYFSPFIASWTDGPRKKLKENDPRTYELKLSEKLEEWFYDSKTLCNGIVRYHAKDRGQSVIIIFDNLDRRDRDQQLNIFQTIQWFRTNNQCISIVALRDETYDAYRDEPPLDAFLKPFTFRISAPRFNNVVKKRLELAFSYLTSNTSEKSLTYETSQGIKISYPANDLGEYLMAIYLSVFDQNRKIRPVLEAISGRNIRRALEMFTSLLLSGYFSDERIFKLTTGGSRSVPEWLILRVLMRIDRQYYSSETGYLKNIFECPESPTANNFLIPEILEYMTRHRKSKSDFRMEGYLLTANVMNDIVQLGYLKEDILWALEYLLNNGLISADHQRDKGLVEQDYIRITASGHYHVRFLPSRSEYLTNVVIDTPMVSSNIAKDVTRCLRDIRDHSIRRAGLLKDAIEEDYNQYCELSPQFRENSLSTDEVFKNLSDAIEFNSRAGGDVVSPQEKPGS